MITVKDRGNVWGFIWPGSDMETIHYDDGSTDEFRTELMEMSAGKYKGWSLDEVTDTGYLNWVLKDAVDKEDVFVEKCVRLRLLELS